MKLPGVCGCLRIKIGLITKIPGPFHEAGGLFGNAGGVSEISRGLSAATPPERAIIIIFRTPKVVPENVSIIGDVLFKRSPRIFCPADQGARMVARFWHHLRGAEKSQTVFRGGRSRWSLNPRLPSGTPPAFPTATAARHPARRAIALRRRRCAESLAARLADAQRKGQKFRDPSTTGGGTGPIVWVIIPGIPNPIIKVAMKQRLHKRDRVFQNKNDVKKPTINHCPNKNAQ
jgi:hypothetical protein